MKQAPMQKSRSTLSKSKELSFNEIMLFMKQAQDDGNAFLIKLDGMRSKKEAQYTVVVGFPNDPEKNVIRSDTNTLREAFQDIMRQYLIYLIDEKVEIKPSKNNEENIFTTISESEEPSWDEVLLCAEKIKEEGNVFIISSGKREYSVSILYPLSTGRKNIESESSTLIEACMKAVRQHLAKGNT